MKPLFQILVIGMFKDRLNVMVENKTYEVTRESQAGRDVGAF